MLIKCPNCSVKYEIPEEINLVEGRKLKCSACNQVFVYTSNMAESSGLQEPSIEQTVISEPTGDEPVLAQQEEISSAEIFLPDPAPETNSADALTATFTPVEHEQEQSPKSGYHLSGMALVFCVLVLIALVFAGFYYSDLISSDYLLGMNRSHQVEMDMLRRDMARRNKVIRVVSDPVAATSSDEEAAPAIDPASASEPIDPVSVVEEARDHVASTVTDEAVPSGALPEVEEKDSVTAEATDEPKVREEVATNETSVEQELAIPVPLVVYKDKEIIRESNGNINVRMKGSVQNPSEHELVLPPVVHAIAFDANGRELFSKDIYLTDRYLDAGQTQDFFGSYNWHPQDQNVQIQWIDMSF